MAFSMLSIGKTALITQRYGLDITGNNIANASTPGYARQRVNLNPNDPTRFTFGAVGTGVGIKSIRHITDEFLETQVRNAKSTNDRLETLQDAYANVEVFFNELTDNDISSAMDEFWNSVSDLVNNVEDNSTRRTVIEEGKTVADSFRNMEEKLRLYRARQNDAIVDTVGDINLMLNEVADLNVQIVRLEAGGASTVVANDLRDQRTETLKNLSGYMNIRVDEDPTGFVTVTQRDRMLVFQDQAFELTTIRETSDDITIDTPVFAADEEELELGDGILDAMVDIRDEVILGYKQDIDQLAASFMWEMNRVHSQGVGLEGWDDLTGATAITDTDVPLDELTFDFTPVAGTYEVVNGNFEIVVYNTESGETSKRDIEIDLDDDSDDTDTILYDPGVATQPENSLVHKLQDALDQMAPGTFTVELTLANKLRIYSDNDQFQFAFGRDTSGVVATLGLNTMFTGTDGRDIAVNETLENAPGMLAGARSFTEGDQDGALALLALRETAVLDSDTTTFDDFYQGIVGRLGIEGARVDSLLETQEDILTRMENQREELSGVNMDEELTKMIQFQRSYQSAARFISTADTLYETVINM